jgi:hypothetical protein
MIGVLRTVKRRWRSLRLFFSNTSYLWTTTIVSHWKLTFYDFLAFFFLVRCFSCIHLMYLGALYTFNYISITY